MQLANQLRDVDTDSDDVVPIVHFYEDVYQRSLFFPRHNDFYPFCLRVQQFGQEVRSVGEAFVIVIFQGHLLQVRRVLYL